MRDKLAFVGVLVVVVLLGIVAMPLVVVFVFVGAALAAVGIPLMFGVMMLSLMCEARVSEKICTRFDDFKQSKSFKEIQFIQEMRLAAVCPNPILSRGHTSAKRPCCDSARGEAR